MHQLASGLKLAVILSGATAIPAERPRIAVLIDGDSVPVRGARRALPAMTRLGRIALCRIYGPLPRSARPSWRAAAAEVPGLPLPDFSRGCARSFSSGDGAIAGTSALSGELAELLHHGVEGICLLSWNPDLAREVEAAEAAGLRIHVFTRPDLSRRDTLVA